MSKVEVMLTKATSARTSFQRLFVDGIHKGLSKMFANKQKIVREEFRFCSRTILILFANNLEIVRELFFAFLIAPFLLFVFNNLSSLHSSTKYALRVRDNIYFRTPRNVLLCLTIYTFVKVKFFMQDSNKKIWYQKLLKVRL